MKKIFNIFTLFVVALIGLSLTGCSDDDVSTNQYASGVNLNVFGPSPVMRGGELRFVGSNLDQVGQVIIPGCDPITSIDVVKAGVPSEIKVTVPKDGPVVGKVKLITNDGKEIETITALTYTEPIEFASFTPADVMPGDVVTLKGDYLNLIQSVGFADGVVVSAKSFVAQSRYELKVAVPAEARTGKISIYDADLAAEDFDPNTVAYNTIESETVLNVGTPSIAKVASPRGEAAHLGTVTAKQGETITITGSYLRLVKAITFGGEAAVEFTEGFKVADDGKSLTIALPATAPDGEINIVTLSGVAVPVAVLQTVAPSELKAAPAPVKNGGELAISGKDLDVVVSLTFPNCEAQEAAAADGAIKVAVPEAAQEGEITLTMANGKTATVAYTLVKPTVAKYSVNPVSAGGTLTIEGTDLDLVAKVVFNGSETPVEVAAENEGKTIGLSVPMDSQSGAVTLQLKNGSEITVAEISIEEAVFCYATALPTDEDEIHAGDVLTLEVKNIDKLTGVEINGTACQYIVSGDKLLIGVPGNANKGSKVRLISSNGEITYKVNFIPNTEITTVLWSGMSALGWSGEGQVYIGTDGGPELIAAGAKAGDEIRIKFTPTADDWCFQLWEGHWGTQYGEFKAENYDLAGNGNCYYLTLTDELISTFTTAGGWGGMLLVQGQSLVVTELALVQHISLETTLWQGDAVADDWGNQPTLLSDGCPELVEAGAKAGQVLRFYITPLDAAWNLQIIEGHWGPQYCDLNQDNWNLAEHNGAVELVLTDDMLKAALTVGGWGGGFILNGDNVKCTKLTIE